MTKTNQATTAEVETNDIDWGVVSGDNTEFTAQYPRLQWAHGEKKASGFNNTGGLFISEEQYPNFTGHGFVPETFITRKKDIPGFASASTLIAVIRTKQQWVKEEKRNLPLLHALVVVKGCPDLLCLSLRGASKTMEFQKAFNQHITHNVTLANRSRPAGSNPLEPFALWFPIKADALKVITSADGKNESAVTSPTLSTPEVLDRNYVTSLWVGSENYRTFVGFYRETAAWQNTKIWVARHDEDQDETPGFSGGGYSGGDGDPATPEMIEHLVNICTAKGFDVRQLVMTITDGQTENVGALTKSEVRNAVEHAKGA